MEQVRLADISVRTFGWIQNPSDFKKLKKVVQVFDHTSNVHRDLKTNRIPRLILNEDDKNRFISELNKIPLKLTYKDLKGKACIPRNPAYCNGILQAIIEGQGRKEFVDDWTADGFIRWAHALGFIEYEYNTDSFYISQLGFDFSRSEDDTDGEKDILIYSMLSYPPAVRVLDLLSLGDHLTKYEIGKLLGFAGESGFTSLPQNILINSLATCDDPEQVKKMKSDWDGSSDKYARMIGGWLSKLGLVNRVNKNFSIEVDGITKSVSIAHAFKITPDGLKALRRAKGINKVARIEKRVHWEMLATKETDKVYVRTRRAYILKALAKASGLITLDQIKAVLSSKGLDENIATIKDDIRGLINIGLNIDVNSRGYLLKDSINDFVIPVVEIEEVQKSSAEELKAELRMQLGNISLDYLQLVDLSKEPKQYRLFEMKVMDLFINELDFNGSHLGEGRRPDGAVYTNDYGIIVDTKAYKGGYSLPISQADEMERYVRENTDRNKEINPNEWWTIFPNNISDFTFLFVSGYFKGNFEGQLQRISISTGVNGGAIGVEHLLLCAEYYKRGILSHDDIRNSFQNKEIEF
ncbi:hypothetical protein LJE39_08745 [Clostridium butyricum]|uniref:restriction endonuclease FokI C-terminal domain-containing protein n=1 Tax=Clostridium butyricum TaxID=1492 RepID=UPI0021C2C8D4|nr:restriction endonuclease FokI C-terminal domain-containing protein [Clostridium butyricum]MCQ2013247.1 hypothetical protein [Clostridium butyricum]